MSFCSDALSCLGAGEVNELNVGYLERRIDRLIPFVGAGLSVDFGFPTWSQLLHQAAERLGLARDADQLNAQRRFEPCC